MANGLQHKGRLIAFEGVDGAGKTTVLALVAERLRARGQRVYVPRVGKDHNSRPTRMIRGITRDRRNIHLRPRSELLMYCAREAQVLDELVQPALARGETVLVDRSLLTPEILGVARGLAEDECMAATRVAASGLRPDLTLVFDVHPRTSRLRKRIEKVRQRRTQEEGGRKGLAGSGFKERVRELYLQRARQAGYPILHAERASPQTMLERAMRAIDGAPPDEVGQTSEDWTPEWQVDTCDFAAGLRQVRLATALVLSRGLVAGRALRSAALADEPQLVAWGLDPLDPLCEQVALLEPLYALSGQRGRPLGGENDLRLRLLSSVPGPALSALRYVTGSEADGLRIRHCDSQPDAVLASLAGREDSLALELRARCWSMASWSARAAALLYCETAASWVLRRELLQEHPALGLSTLRGLRGADVDQCLLDYADLAPRCVLDALLGRRDALAYALREQLFETGREVIESVRGLDDPRAFGLRERAVERWPAEVIHSLEGVTSGDASLSLLERCRNAGAGDLHVLRRLQAFAEWAERPEWSRGPYSTRLAGGNEMTVDYV